MTADEKTAMETKFKDLKARDFTDYKYRVYSNLQAFLKPNPLEENIYQAVCAKACPLVEPANAKLNDAGKAVLEFDIMPTTNYTKNIDSTTETGKLSLEITNADDMINLVIMNSTSKYFTCIPSTAAEFAEDTDKIIDKLLGFINVGFGSYISDISKAKVPLIIMAFVVIVITFVYIQLLQCITKPILYGSLLGIFLMLAAATYASYDNFAKFDKDAADSTDYKFALTILVVMGILTVLYMILVCCMWKAISLGASVMETASDYISDNRYITVLPFGAYLMCAPIVLWWTVTAVYIYGLGTPVFAEKAFVSDMQSSKETTGMFLYEMFGFFWIVAWIIAVQLFVTCCSVCLWYFGGHGSDEGEQGDKPMGVFISIKWAFRYHLGSLAWGAFIIAIVTTIRVVFEYFVYQYEKAGMKDNIVFKIVTCIIRCYLKCLDCCVKFMNKNAYIQVALHNVNFCTGAKQSFWIIA